MQFGIMEMQVSTLIPAVTNPAEATAHLVNFDHAEHVRKLADTGSRQSSWAVIWPCFSQPLTTHLLWINCSG